MAADPEVIDAINATMVSNGVKAINADSVRNLLLLMAEKLGGGSGGGSGDGALRVIVPDMMMVGSEIVAMGEFSPASWEEMKSLFEQGGLDLSEYDAVAKASFEHNANVAQQIIEKGKAGQEGVSVVLDQTPYFPAIINISLQMEPEMATFYEDFALCAVQPAGFMMQYIKPTPEGESMFGGNNFSCVLAPVGNMDLEELTNYPSNMLIQLNLDGSLTFTVIESETESGS